VRIREAILTCAFRTKIGKRKGLKFEKGRKGKINRK
jgi:hypothetical protein